MEIKPARGIEQGPIRPPSEAESLLIRVTRNCPWNRCAFCRTYRHKKFSARGKEEILADISLIRQMVKTIEEACPNQQENAPSGAELANLLVRQGYERATIASVFHWLAHGGKGVFLQDGDSLTLKTADLAEIIRTIRDSFPRVERITSYCRSRTAARKSEEDFKLLAQSGLNRIHMGMESGSDEVLSFIDKGSSSEDLLNGGRKIRSAGISLCQYVMPGLGGKNWSETHARDSAAVVTAVAPEYVRLRTLFVVSGTPLFQMVEQGKFQPLGEEDILKEIRLFITLLGDIDTFLVSDHILNLLEELEGNLATDRERMLAIIDRYFNLSPEERLAFRLGRRLGYFRRLDDLKNRQIYGPIGEMVALGLARPDLFEEEIRRIMGGYI